MDALGALAGPPGLAAGWIRETNCASSPAERCVGLSQGLCLYGKRAPAHQKKENKEKNNRKWRGFRKTNGFSQIVVGFPERNGFRSENAGF